MNKRQLLKDFENGRYYFQQGSLFLAVDVKKVIVDDVEEDEIWFIDFQNGSLSINIELTKEVPEIPFFNGDFKKVYKVKCKNNQDIGYIAL